MFMVASEWLGALVLPLLFDNVVMEGLNRESRLVSEFEAVCLQTNGDADIVAEVATARGYTSSKDQVPHDLFRSDRLSVFERVEGDMGFRVTSRPSSMSSSWEGAIAQNLCHVAMLGGDRSRARSILTERLDIQSFRQGSTAVFAWLPREDGGRRAVSRHVFEGSFLRLMQTSDLRFVTVTMQSDLLILGLVARNPLEFCRRFAGYRECYSFQ